ncbi:MAG TPA: hypothetical protein VIM61_08340 [Chthoniobacterales bacterium]
MNPPKKPSRRTAPAPRPIIHAIQVYDGEKFGFPLAVFEGTGQFQDIAKGDTLDGGDWPPINGHKHYARIYRITAIRHTLTTNADGSVKHLKSLFVEPVVSRSRKGTAPE